MQNASTFFSRDCLNNAVPEELPISSLKQKKYYRLATIYEANSLRELNAKKRVAVLICFICQKRKQLIDHTVQTHASIMASSIKHSKKKLDEHTRKKKKSLTTAVKRYVEIGELLIQAKEESLPYPTSINFVVVSKTDTIFWVLFLLFLLFFVLLAIE